MIIVLYFKRNHNIENTLGKGKFNFIILKEIIFFYYFA